MLENDSSLFKVNVENYNGSLDVLLDLAKAQKVNLEDISITKLADQFHDFITNEKDLNFGVMKSRCVGSSYKFAHVKILRTFDKILGLGCLADP